MCAGDFRVSICVILCSLIHHHLITSKCQFYEQVKPLEANSIQGKEGEGVMYGWGSRATPYALEGGLSLLKSLSPACETL